MKKLLLPLLIVLSFASFGQLWTEDFSGEANGATTGTAGGSIGGTWSVTTLPSGGAASFSRQEPVASGIPTGVLLFRANQTGNEGVWNSGDIDISGTGMASVSINLITAGTNTTDYVRAYYKVDGGPEVLFAELLGTFFDTTTPGSAIISGGTLQIIVRARENTTGNFLFVGPPNAIGFDDLSISAVPVVYSRASAAWDLPSTWSSVGFTGPADVLTPPTNGQVAVIGGGFTVDLAVDATVGGVDIRDTGTLRYTAANVDLGIEQGLLRVRSGGTLNENSQTDAQIDFNQDVGGATLQVDAGGVVTIDDVTLTTNASNLHYFAGGGTLAITDDILIGADDATLTNNITTTVAITDRIEFSAATNNSSFINNSTITAGTLFFDDDNNTFTNNGPLGSTLIPASIGLNVNDDGNTFANAAGITAYIGTIDLNNSNFTLNNSGTINQSGNFSNVDTGSNGNFNNLATGIWNWSLTPNTTFDTSMGTVLDCAAVGNTFNYNGAGDQRIIPVQYGNLTLSISGAKDSNNANISVNGNWTVSGTASFTEGTGTVTWNGTTAQTITSPGGETYYNLTINNSFATSPQITLNNAVTVSAVLTMTDGNVHLKGNTFTLSQTASGALVHNGASTAGWMYGDGSGSRIVRGFRAAGGDITIPNVDGLIPIGTAINFRPFVFGKTSAAGSSGAIAINTGDPGTTTTGLNIVDPSGGANVILRNNSAWVSTLTGGTGATFSIRYGGTGLGIATSLTHLKSMLLSSMIQTHVTATTVSLTDPRVQRSGLSAAQMTNTFYMGSTNAASPLPIELLFFNAKLNNDVVELSWATASEKDNDFFTIERAIDIEQFETVGDVIDGNGTTNERSDYITYDETPLYGRSYYRLKQTDFDGKFTYSDVKVVNYDGPRFSSLQVYPNPSEGNTLTIVVTGLKEQTSVPVQIYNVQGQKVYDQVLDVSTPGTLKYDVEFGSPLKQGLYIIKAGQTLDLTQKIIVD